MCIRASNSQHDRTLISCGYHDDGMLRVWDYRERLTVAEILNQHFSHRDTIYNVNLITFDDPEALKDLKTENILNHDEYSRSKYFIIQ